MGRMQSVTECRKGNEFTHVAERQNGIVEHRGPHDVIRAPDGRGCVPVSRSPREIPTGTRRSIIKALLALGFMAVVLVYGVQCITEDTTIDNSALTSSSTSVSFTRVDRSQCEILDCEAQR